MPTNDYEYRTLNVGPAETFRGDLNFNFEAISDDFENMDVKVDNKIMNQDTQPALTDQNEGGVWLAPFSTAIV